MWIVVLLPAPFGPRKPKKRPRATRKDTRSTAVCRRNVFVRPSTTIASASLITRKVSRFVLAFPPADDPGRRRSGAAPAATRADEDPRPGPGPRGGRDGPGRRCRPARTAPPPGWASCSSGPWSSARSSTSRCRCRSGSASTTSPTRRTGPTRSSATSAPRPAAPCASASSSSGRTRRAGRTRCPGSSTSCRATRRRSSAGSSSATRRLSLKLGAEQAPGGVAVEERTVAEDVGQWGAQVRATTLPVVKGAILQVEEIGGDFKTRAEVRNVSIGADGHPRLNLLFLDCPHPGAAPARGGRRREAGGLERMQGQPEAERRRERRVPLKVPVRVRGRDADGAGWEEMSRCEDASIERGGPARVPTRSVPGRSCTSLCHCPRASASTTSTTPPTGPTRSSATPGPWRPAARVGVLFLGRHPPRGAEALPAETFLMPGERVAPADPPRR